jgi:diguanylate cyclase (GGDEF)-like protein
MSGESAIQPRPVVVVADDDDATRDLVTRWLQKGGYDVRGAASGEEALRVIAGISEIACVVLDVMMPGMNGIEVLERLRTDARFETLSILLLTAHATGDEDVVRGMELGASDYMFKPFSGPVLTARVKALALRTEKDRNATMRLQEAEAHASIDVLTALYNRRHFDRTLVEEAARARRHRTPCSLVILDVDHFKSVNDTLGHPEGDRALRHLAEILRKTLRGEDRAFRYGGEEFALLLPGTSADAAVLAVTRIRNALVATPFPFPESFARRLTFSAGIASLSEKTDFTFPGVIEAADRALYRAKQLGRDRTELAT